MSTCRNAPVTVASSDGSEVGDGTGDAARRRLPTGAKRLHRVDARVGDGVGDRVGAGRSL